jgi:hypothetical protein
MNMQTPTAKELEYIVDSMSNEELMLKQCAAVASITTNPGVRSLCQAQVQTHEQHLHTLMNVLHQGMNSTNGQFAANQQQMSGMQQH